MFAQSARAEESSILIHYMFHQFHVSVFQHFDKSKETGIYHIIFSIICQIDLKYPLEKVIWDQEFVKLQIISLYNCSKKLCYA